MNTSLIVIGAQKCGTATLTKDLSLCHEFWVDPERKEDSPLLDLSSEAARESAQRWFNKGGEGNRVPVNISTRYSMYPMHIVDVGQVATDFPDSRILYIMREPLERTLSHHHHDQVLGLTNKSAEESITQGSPYVVNSLYGAQLAVWMKFYPESQIMLIKFEDYVANRLSVVTRICEFAGVSSKGVEKIKPSNKYNVTAEREKFHPVISKIIRSSIYLEFVKGVFWGQGRKYLKKLMAGQNNLKRSVISEQLSSELNDVYESDGILLRALHKDAPCWKGGSLKC